MAKPTIVTRAGKGSALTWTEGDTNLTNLRDATISVTDGTNTKALNLNDTLTFTAGTNVTLSVNATTGAVTINSSNPGGTVTSVAALTLGTSGTDVSSTVANGTSTPVITLNIPTASASNRGALSSTDWSTFNGKQSALVSGTNIKTVNNTSLLGSGDLGTIGLGYGGTGKTTAPAAMANLIGFTTTATGGTTTTLTSSSSYYQIFTGSSAQTVQLPDTSTLATGWSYHIVNNSTGALTIQTSTAVSLGTVPSGVTIMATVVSIAGNTAAAWETGYTDFSSLTGTGNVVLATSPTLTTPTIGVATATSVNKVTITAPATSATLTIADGKTLTASNTLTFTGTDSSSVAFGTGGTVLYSGGALGTPSSGTVTNLTGTASININGTVGATTANTGAFTTITASGAYTGTVTTTGNGINITYNPSSATGAAVQATGKDSQGGTGYFDFFKATNTTTGVTNGSKSFRLNSTGALEIINSSYSSTIFSLTDGGALTVAGLTVTSASTLKDIRETVYAIGNSGATTLTPDAANGSIQTITATGNFTLSAFSNPVSGQSITFIITQDGTGSRTLTSTMKFAGGSKTLSTAASSIDIMTVSYIGTTYYASLAKAFA